MSFVNAFLEFPMIFETEGKHGKRMVEVNHKVSSIPNCKFPRQAAILLWL